MVLETRENAENVQFPIVGEQEKTSSNVIDYNIREEQTKDAFAASNANNQTTTGMANVIPGINAPKLLADTSIIGGEQSGGGTVSSVTVTGSVSGGYSNVQYGNFSYTSIGPLSFGSSSNSLKIPADGIYTVQLNGYDQQIGYSPNTGDKNTFSIQSNGTTIASFTFAFRLLGTVGGTYQFNMGDIITFWVDSDTNASTSFYCSATITKL